MTATFTSSVGLRIAPEPDAEVDRDVLTDTLFRCISECDSDDEIQGLREQVVAINMHVADSLARRYFGHGENNDDLKQVAYLGLIRAVRGFDAQRGLNFLSYAVPTITGELKKHFRDRCWTVRPPRRIQDLQRNITVASEAIDVADHCRPTAQELAEWLDAPVADVTEAMTARGCFTPTSLDVHVKDDSSTTLAELLPSGDAELERCETHLLLAPVIKSLPESDREVLTLRFFEEWTQERIARKLGTTQMQISRRLARIMQQLRVQLESQRPCA